MTTPWDVSTASLVETHILEEHSGLADTMDLVLTPNGDRMFTLDSGGTRPVLEWHLDDEQMFTGNFSATSSLWALTVGDTATVSPAARTKDQNPVLRCRATREPSAASDERILPPGSM